MSISRASERGLIRADCDGRHHAVVRPDAGPCEQCPDRWRVGGAEHLHIIERFTRIDENTIDYQYTVDDPTTFTRSWTVKVPMRRIGGPLYEYACHEGNYSMAGMLRGRRAEEKAVEEQTPADGRK
jgi:hypothetical protein